MNIKIKRAGKITGLAKYPRTYEDILKNIPGELINSITSKQLAEIIKINQKAYALGQQKNQEEIDDFLGCRFWDNAGKIVEIIDKLA